jgi:hypothetical protein
VNDITGQQPHGSPKSLPSAIFFPLSVVSVPSVVQNLFFLTTEITEDTEKREARRGRPRSYRAKRSQFAPRRPASAPVASVACAAGGAANRAKRTQFPPAPGEGQVFSGQRVMVNRTCEELRQNEANLCPTNRRGGGTGREGPQGRGATGPRGWNQSCETNPISAVPAIQTPHHSNIPALGRRPGGYRAKRTQFGPARPAARAPLCSVATRATADGGRGAARLAFRPASRETVSACQASVYALRRSGTAFADMKLAGQYGGISRAEMRIYDEI